MLKRFAINSSNINEVTVQILDFINDKIDGFKLPTREANRVRLMSEESLGMLIEHGNFSKPNMIHVRIKKFLGNISIEITAPGAEFDFARSMSINNTDEDYSDALRDVILRSFGDRIRYKNRRGRNGIRIRAVRSEYSNIYQIFAALLLAAIAGTLMRAFLPADTLSYINTNIIENIHSMIMNALKVVVAPVVFFSIVTCISQFGNLSEMGRIGGKIIFWFLATMIIAVIVSISIEHFIQPGTSLAGIVPGDAVQSEGADISFMKMLVDIVPANIMKPFIEEDMMQLIFIAVVFGVAVTMIGEYSKALVDFFEACNSLFLMVTSMAASLVPLMTFCSVLSIFLTTGGKTLLLLTGAIFTILAAIAIMLAVYAVLIVTFCRVNPLILYRKYLPVMAYVMGTLSCVASIPNNMRLCESLGVPRKIYSMSIPLGATIGMDGLCITLTTWGLVMARAYGIEIDSSFLMSLGISALILSISAPGVPGGGLVMLSAMFAHIGVPIEAVGLMIAVYAVLAMAEAGLCTLGNVVASMLTASSEGILDTKQYYRG